MQSPIEHNTLPSSDEPKRPSYEHVSWETLTDWRPSVTPPVKADILGRLQAAEAAGDDLTAGFCCEQLGHYYQARQSPQPHRPPYTVPLADDFIGAVFFFQLALGFYQRLATPAGEEQDKLAQVRQRLAQALATVDEQFLTTGLGLDAPMLNISDVNTWQANTTQDKAELAAIRRYAEQAVKTLPSSADARYVSAVQAVYTKIAEDMRAFLTRCWQESLKRLEIIAKPPCDYAVILFGSAADGLLTPYSDMEWGILIDTDSEDARHFFQRMTQLMHLRVLNLGETTPRIMNHADVITPNWKLKSPLPNGLSFDGAGDGGCKTPLGKIKDGKAIFSLIQTPAALAAYQTQSWLEQERLLPGSLVNVRYLAGSLSLVKRYQQAVRQRLQDPVEGRPDNNSITAPAPFHHYLGQRLLAADLSRFKPKGGKVEAEGRTCSVKHDFYRLPNMVINQLALMANLVPEMANLVPETNDDLWQRIVYLQQDGYWSEAAAHDLRRALSQAGALRLACYTALGEQAETAHISHEGQAVMQSRYGQTSFSLEESTLFSLYYTLVPFFEAVRFYSASANKDRLYQVSQAGFHDQGDRTQGYIYQQLLRFPDAEACFNRAARKAQENAIQDGIHEPELAARLIELGGIQQDLSQLQASLRNMEIALDILKNCYGGMNLEVGVACFSLGDVYRRLEQSDKAKPYLSEAQRIFNELCGAEHPNTAKCNFLLAQLGLTGIPPSEHDLLAPLRKNLEKRLEDPMLAQALSYYVEPEVTHSRGSESRQSLWSYLAGMEKQPGFLDDPQKLLLLQGDSGAGKSLGLYHLARLIWALREAPDSAPRELAPALIKSLQSYVPILIDLKSLGSAPQEFIPWVLKERYGYTPQQIQALKTRHRVLFLFDGYDELSGPAKDRPLYQDNQLGEWNAKVIISCRSEYLYRFTEYRSLFNPSVSHHLGSAWQERWLAPFSATQIDAYLQRRTQQNHALDGPSSTEWSLERYQESLRSLSGLKELVTSPLLLHMVVEALPQLVTQPQSQAHPNITRATVYQAFIERWFTREIQRLRNLDKEKQFRDLTDRSFNDFAEKLAFTMFSAEPDKTLVEIPYTSRQQQEEAHDEFAAPEDAPPLDRWEAFFSDSDQKIMTMRAACPLRHSGGTYSFYHKSFLEYFAASRVYRGLMLDQPDAQRTPSILKTLTERPLSRKLLTSEPAMLDFLSERVQGDALKIKRLFAIVEASKTDPAAAIAAANAITLLNVCRVSFAGLDLSGIRIPGADLSAANLDNTNLSGAHLQGVRLYQAWLRQACLKNADLTGAILAEKPLVRYENLVTAIAYSADGRYRAVGVDKDVIVEELCTGARQVLAGHTYRVTSVAWSASGDLASGSWDNSVIVWDVKESRARQVLSGHTGSVYSVAWSASGDLASGSSDKSVIVWDVKESRARQVLAGHTHFVTSVAWSASGDLASGSWDKSVIVWDVKESRARQVLAGHTREVTSVAWSASGDLASGSDDHSVIVWDVKESRVRQVLAGHTNSVSSVAWSASGDLASGGSRDNSVIVWDVKESRVRQVLAGHTGSVESVAWSASGDLASGSLDKSVIVWDVKESRVRQVLAGHTKSVTSVAWSASGDLASGSRDKRVIVWDVKESRVRQVLAGHTHFVSSVAWSASGDLASGSWDNSVIVWDVKESRVRQTLAGHTSRVSSVAWSATGELASGDYNGTAILWDLSQGRPRAVLGGHLGGVSALSWYEHAGQSYIATGGEDHSVKLWQRVAQTKTADTWQLVWSSHPRLWAERCQLKGVRGLTQEQIDLLRQREAVGKPLPAKAPRLLAPPVSLAKSPHSFVATLGKTTPSDPAASPLERWLRAIQEHDLKTLKRLLATGIDVNSRDPGDYQATGLHHAAGGGNKKVVAWLLNNGANPRLTDASGETPWQWAKANGHKAVAKLIEEKLKQLEPQDGSDKKCALM